MKATFLFLTILGACFAQMRNNTTPELKCDGGNWGRGARTCDVREQTVAYAGQLTIDAGRNGGVSVKGANRSDVLVRMKVEAGGDTESEAKALAGQVRPSISAGRISSTGPSSGNWSVSYEVFVPHQANLEITAHNGGINLADVRGNIQFSTNNGGVHVARLGGNVKGQTTNGGVHVELEGNRWDGQGLDLRSTNGGVNLSVPANYSAELEASTTNGGVKSDFASGVDTADSRRQTHIKTTLGAGGAPVKLVTTNGGVKVTRM